MAEKSRWAVIQDNTDTTDAVGKKKKPPHGGCIICSGVCPSSVLKPPSKENSESYVLRLFFLLSFRKRMSILRGLVQLQVLGRFTRRTGAQERDAPSNFIHEVFTFRLSSVLVVLYRGSRCSRVNGTAV